MRGAPQPGYTPREKVPEVFAETIEGVEVPDLPAYWASGNVDPAPCTVESRRALWRLRYGVRERAVHWELLASFHWRIIGHETREHGGEPLAVIAGRTGPRGWMVKVPVKWLEASPVPRSFWRAVYNVCGATGCVFPGRREAAVRALWALSLEGETMPAWAEQQKPV